MASSRDNLNEQDALPQGVVVEGEDAGDRAMRFRNFDKSRVDLKLIGFWPGNPGGVGISSKQVHNVCEDNESEMPHSTI